MDETQESRSSSAESVEYGKDHDLNLEETPQNDEPYKNDSAEVQEDLKEEKVPQHFDSNSSESNTFDNQTKSHSEESKDSMDQLDPVKDQDDEKKEELYAKNKEFFKEEKEVPVPPRDETLSTREKPHKRHLKGSLDRKNKKTKKQKLSSAIIKDSYLDTMAEESEGSVVDDDEDEDEEEEDDPLGTEIPEELKDFITDEVVEEEEEEEEATDVEYEPDKLDEEDLELIAENTGSKWLDDDEEDFKKLRRLKKGIKKVEPEPEQEDMWYDEEENRSFELSDVWATVAECFGQVDLVIQILKNERNTNAVPMEQDSDYDPQYDPDYEKDTELVEQVEKFKLSEKQYSQEEKVLEQNLEQYVDPDELAKEYLTKEDDEIRQVDEPERLYVRYKKRTRKIEEREIKNESQWMTRRLLNEFNIDLSKENVKKAYEQTFESTYKSNHTSVSTDVEEKCEMLLNWLLNERWEVPFILYHKKHLICPPLNENIVWRVFQLDLEWVRLNTISEQVQKNIEKIGHEFLPTDILYFSTNFDYLEDLNDVNVHLTYHYPKLYMKADEKEKKRLSEEPETEMESPQDQEAEPEYMEDDIFGDFEPIENAVHNAIPPSSPGNEEKNEELTKVKEEEKEGLSKEEYEDRLKMEKMELEENELANQRDEDYSLFDHYEVDQENKSNNEQENTNEGNSNENEDEQKDEEEEEVVMETEEEDEEEEEESDEKEKEDEENDMLEERENEKESKKFKESRDEERVDYRSLVVKKDSSLYLIETIERLGMDKVCTRYMPTPNEFHKLMEKGVVSMPNMEFKVEVTSDMYNSVVEEEKGDLETYRIEEEMSSQANVIELDMELLPGNEEYQIEEYFSGYTKGPYTTGKRVFNALTEYWAKKYSTHISVKRMLREYYREYCNITCVTTPKGEEQVEVSEPSWLVKRMTGFPVKRLVKSAQMYYNYPNHYPEKRERYIYLNDRLRELKMVELYMQILKLEKEEQVKVTVHPLTQNEQPYWKGEQYSKRFQDFYATYKDLTNFVNTQNSNTGNYNNTNYNEQLRQMENEKTLIEKEQILLNDLHQRDIHFVENMVNELTKLFVKKKVSRNSVWRHFYKGVAEKMVNRELVPLFRREVRESLYKSATNSVLFNCQQFLTYKVESGASKDNVMCMLNDTEGQNVYVGVVESKGKVGYLKIYKNLMQTLNYNSSTYGGGYNDKNVKGAVSTWAQQVGNMLDKFEVKTILVGLVDLNSLLLYHRIQEHVLSKSQKKVRVMKAETQLPRLVASKYLMTTSRNKQKNNLNTNFGNDVLGNANETGASGGSDHNYYLIMAVSVCRFHQNFLMEMTSLWSETGENYILRVKLHPLQELLPKERLEQGIEQVLITEVNKKGVGLDVLQETNWPKSQSYLSGLKNVMGEQTNPGLTEYINMKGNVLNYLSFISGLGVRKAQLLLDKLRTFTPSSRSSLTQIFGPVVFLNVASFIKFEQNETTDSLDTSRIHPTESGFIAEKLCNGSLDEKLSGEEAVAEIMENPSKLDDLDLEAYSVLLNDMQEMPRMYPYLLFIKNELQNPYGNNTHLKKEQKSDRQKEEKERDMTNQEVFYSVLNLDKNGFKSGSSVNVKFESMQHRAAKVVLLPLLLKGHVNDLQQFRSDIQKLAKDNPKYNNLTGEVFEGRVSRIDYEPILEGGTYNYRVEVSLTTYQKRHMLNAFLNDLVNQRLEEYMSPLTKYDINHSNLPINTQKKKMQYRRNIRHPAYKMWPIQKVISYLKQNEVPVGESCICPMSEWDRLNLVIKTCSDPFNFATFVIYEKGQRIPGELGKELMLQNEKYNNIDQIIAQFCETLKLNLEEFYTHPKFRHNCELNKVERDLIQESALKPDNITWAIIPPNPKRAQGVNHPLRFILVVIPPGFSVISQEAKSLQDPIYVTHKSFKLWTHEEKSLRDLIAWWKEYGYWHRNLERTKYIQEKQNNYNNY